MRRGFTLIELLIASAISALLFAATVVAFGSIWMLMKGSSDELELAIHARTVREYLLVRADKDHRGLFGVNAKILEGPTLTSGFNVELARYEPAANGSVTMEVFKIPDDDRLFYLRNTKPKDVGATGNVVDKVYDNEFMQSTFRPVANQQVTSLIRMNIHHHPYGVKNIIYEDHPIFFMENGIKW